MRQVSNSRNHNRASRGPENKMTNRTTITIFTRQKTLIIPVDAALVGRCERCDTEVFSVSRESAASVLGVAYPAILELIKSGVLHALPAPLNATVICSNSLCLAASHFTEEVQTKTS